MNNQKGQKFWLDDICALFTPNGLTIIPTTNMTLNEKLNALTRLAIIVSIIMYILDYQYWLIFLLVSVLLILALKYLGDRNNLREGFRSPYYIGNECELETPIEQIVPSLGEWWQTPPVVYNERTILPPETQCYGECAETPIDFGYDSSYPIPGQYIVGNSSKLLPNRLDEIRNMPLDDAKLTMNTNFDIDQLTFRNDMIRTFVNKQDRWYNTNNCDRISPWSSCS